jgi:threonine synthase
MAYGARILAVKGNFDDAFRLVKRAAGQMDIVLVNSVNPNRIQGQKTAAFEIVDDLGDAPDLLCIPVGNAGNITAYWRGFKDYWQAERSGSLPRMMGFQAAGAAPLVHGKPVESPETVATAIRIGNPASWDGAIEARDDSSGIIDAVTDDQIVDAYLRLARTEGIFCEPAAAAAVAGLLRLSELGVSVAGKTVVCIITGNGLKDPSTAERRARVELEYVEPVFEEVEALLSGERSRV